jgi:hypothetical protein
MAFSTTCTLPTKEHQQQQQLINIERHVLGAALPSPNISLHAGDARPPQLHTDVCAYGEQLADDLEQRTTAAMSRTLPYPVAAAAATLQQQ